MDVPSSTWGKTGTCLECGHKFQYGEGDREEISQEERPKKTEKTEQQGGLGRFAFIVGALTIGIPMYYGFPRYLSAYIPGGPIAIVVAGLILSPVIALRLQNVGTSGWWALLILIPMPFLQLGVLAACCSMQENYLSSKADLDTVGYYMAILFFILAFLLYAALPPQRVPREPPM